MDAKQARFFKLTITLFVMTACVWLAGEWFMSPTIHAIADALIVLCIALQCIWLAAGVTEFALSVPTIAPPGAPERLKSTLLDGVSIALTPSHRPPRRTSPITI